MRVLVVDDLLATGGTLVGACELVKKCGGVVADTTCLIELSELGGRAKVTANGVHFSPFITL
jgi:adenine phosphoribosyltransferase